MPGVETKYKILFNIQIRHNKIRNEQDVLFEVQPTPDCAALLQRLRWLFKPRPNGAWVVVPFDGRSNTPLTPLETLTRFEFILRAKSGAVQKNTLPFERKGLISSDPENTRWLLAGKPLLYFTNLDPEGKLDNKPVEDTLLKDQYLSRDKFVGLLDSGIITSRKMSNLPGQPLREFLLLPVVNRVFTKLTLLEARPGQAPNEVASATLSAAQSVVQLDLGTEAGAAYQLHCSNGQTAYTYPVYPTRIPFSSAPLGILEIFQNPEHLNNLAQPTNYLIAFKPA